MKFKTSDAPVIIAYGRTPFTLLNGGLSKISPIDFSAQCIQQLICRSGISSNDVTDVIVGNVLQAGLGQLPAKQIAMKVGLPTSVTCSSVNMVCSSGMNAIISAARIVSMEPDRVVIAGGYESMSQSPYASLSNSRGTTLPKISPSKLTQSPADLPLVDLLSRDGLTDALTELPMGNIAEMCAKMDNIGRELQDAYCIASYRRAQTSQTKGLLREITPVVLYNVPEDITSDNIHLEERSLGSCNGSHRVVESPKMTPEKKSNGFKQLMSGSVSRFAHSPRAVVTVKHNDVVELDEGPSKLDESKVGGLRGCFNGWGNNIEDYKIDTSDYGFTIDGDCLFDEYLKKEENKSKMANTSASNQIETLTPKSITNSSKYSAPPSEMSLTKKIPSNSPSTHTAANSSKLSDGAAFVIVVSQDYYRRHKEQIMGNSEFHEPPIFIESFTSVGTHPSLFPIAPSKAVDKLLSESSISLKDISHVEINEAFSSIALNNALRIGLTMEDILDPSSKKFNASGGGVSIGHPLGASGARLIVTLCRQLNEDVSVPKIITPTTAQHIQDEKNEFRGLAAICNGGGGACAIMLRTGN